jgi:NADH dehydrogenase
MKEINVLIVGGGFGGIRAALDLSKKNIPNLHIKLVSNKHHFEYYPTLYKAVTGKSPLEVCIPLSEIFFHKNNVEIVVDEIVDVNSTDKIVTGKSGSKYNFDYLVLALGSETVYFNIPNLEKYSYSCKSIEEAMKLKKHIHEMFEMHHDNIAREELVADLHFLIVGGGASGVELAGELAVYLQNLSKLHNLDKSLITIDILEAAPRLLPTLPEDIAERVTGRLRSLGVNIFVNRALVSEDLEQVYMKDMSLKTKTVIWTAGIKTNHFYSKISGLSFSKRSRVEVDEYLEAKGIKNVFVIGDAAETQYAGLAQTAIHNGTYVADVIENKIKDVNSKAYVPKKVSYVVPVGPHWAAAAIGSIHIYGFLGLFLREFIDFIFFLTILPFRKAFVVFRSGEKLCESCHTCREIINKNK